jgi:hypothetical protein
MHNCGKNRPKFFGYFCYLKAHKHPFGENSPNQVTLGEINYALAVVALWEQDILCPAKHSGVAALSGGKEITKNTILICRQETGWPDFSWHNIPKRWKMYQIATMYITK